MTADSSLILNALIAKLGSDLPLLALMPNGVYEDLSPSSTRFVIVSQIISTDVAKFGPAGQRRAWEDMLVLVEARSRNGGDVHAAAQRIDDLLEDGTLTVAGFGLMRMSREEFTRGTVPQEGDTSIMWTRRGGRYRIQMAVKATTTRAIGDAVHTGDTP